MTRNFQEYLARKRHEYGTKFDPSQLATHFVRYFENGHRIEVKSLKYDHVRRGRVSVTTGWRPVFLLMSRVSAIGSSDCLNEHDEVVRVVAV